MQSASRANPITAEALDTAEPMLIDREPKAVSKWFVSILVPILVPVIGVVTVLIQSGLQESRLLKEQKAQELRAAVEKKEAFCHRGTALLVEIDTLLQKTRDPSELAQWGRSEWDSLDDKLAALRILYLEVPNTADQSIAARLKVYSEFVGDKWRGPVSKNCPEMTRREYYQESYRYFSDAQTVLREYRGVEALQIAEK